MKCIPCKTELQAPLGSFAILSMEDTVRFWHSVSPYGHQFHEGSDSQKGAAYYTLPLLGQKSDNVQESDAISTLNDDTNLMGMMYYKSNMCGCTGKAAVTCIVCCGPAECFIKFGH